MFPPKIEESTEVSQCEIEKLSKVKKQKLTNWLINTTVDLSTRV